MRINCPTIVDLWSRNSPRLRVLGVSAFKLAVKYPQRRAAKSAETQRVSSETQRRPALPVFARRRLECWLTFPSCLTVQFAGDGWSKTRRLQWNTQVTLNESTHTVSQAYCSALPVAYSNHPKDLWEPFARLVLEATDEATICAAILNSQRDVEESRNRSTGNNRVFLTLVGGRAFGNEPNWIFKAMKRALRLYEQVNLDIAIVSYGSPNPAIQQLTEPFE